MVDRHIPTDPWFYSLSYTVHPDSGAQGNRLSFITKHLNAFLVYLESLVYLSHTESHVHISKFKTTKVVKKQEILSPLRICNKISEIPFPDKA